MELGAWQPILDGPLSPRENAFAIGIGEEVLVVGGSYATPCPPNADCGVPDKPPLADGAIFNSDTGRWRSIAPTPEPIWWAEGAVIGATVYVWASGSERSGNEEAFLAYDPATGTWGQLPYDPLSPSFDRSMVWAGGELVLFDMEHVPQPGSDGPSVARAAALDVESGSWRRLPDSEIIATGPFVDVGGLLVNPALGWADGGEVNGWDRAYPYGGILDPANGQWSPLPAPPAGQREFSVGLVAADRGHYIGEQGWVLDMDTGMWIDVPPLDDVRTDAVVRPAKGRDDGLLSRPESIASRARSRGSCRRRTPARGGWSRADPSPTCRHRRG